MLGKIESTHQSLESLAGPINECHQKVVEQAKKAVEYAIQAGESLILAKRICASREWGNFVATHCQFSPRTARLYAWLAANKDKAFEAKTLNEAIRLIRGNDPKLIPQEKMTDEDYFAGSDYGFQSLAGYGFTVSDFDNFKKYIPSPGYRICGYYRNFFVAYLGSRRFPGCVYRGNLISDEGHLYSTYSIKPFSNSILGHTALFAGLLFDGRLKRENILDLKWFEPKKVQFDESPRMIPDDDEEFAKQFGHRLGERTSYIAEADIFSSETWNFEYLIASESWNFDG